MKQRDEEKGHDDLETIDLEAYAEADRRPPIGKQYKVRIGNDYFVFDHHLVTGKELLTKAGKTPIECYSLYLKLKGCDFEKISQNEKVDLLKSGIEKFVVKDPEVFYYTVDDEPETTEEKFMDASEILKATGLKPLDYYLVQIFADGSQKSYKDLPREPIKMECPGHKFVTVFRGETPVS